MDFKPLVHRPVHTRSAELPTRISASIEPSLLEPLGRVVANANVVEFYMALALSEITNADFGTFRARMMGDLIKELGKAFSKYCAGPLKLSKPMWRSLDDDWSKLEAELKDVLERRNAVVHAFWQFDPEAGPHTRGHRVKRTLVSEHFNISKGDLDTLADDMAYVAAHVADMFYAAGSYAQRCRTIASDASGRAE